MYDVGLRYIPGDRQGFGYLIWNDPYQGQVYQYGTGLDFMKTSAIYGARQPNIRDPNYANSPFKQIADAIRMRNPMEVLSQGTQVPGLPYSRWGDIYSGPQQNYSTPGTSEGGFDPRTAMTGLRTSRENYARNKMRGFRGAIDENARTFRPPPLGNAIDQRTRTLGPPSIFPSSGGSAAPSNQQRAGDSRRRLKLR